MIQSVIRTRRRSRAVALVVLAGLMLAPGAVSAHPLGNFTINHYSGLHVEPDRVLVDHVIDYAEIPTFQERQAMDRAGDGDGTVSDAEAVAYRDAACARQASALELVVNGERLPLAVGGAAVLFPQGQAGAPTLRLVCAMTGTLTSGDRRVGEISFSDATYAERLGWREIVVTGNGVAISGPVGSVPPTVSPSARLTAYPDDLLTEPLRISSVALAAIDDGPTGPSFVAPELAAGGPLVVVPTLAAGGCSDATTVLPGGSTDFGRQICEIVQARDLTPVAIGISLFVAGLIGAAHALSPGHGKTVMAAYLVGARGGMRHAVGLGLTVTVSHTIGVLALGGLTLYASSFLPPDRLQLVLGVASGVILIALGLYLVLTRLRVTRRERAARAAVAMVSIGSRSESVVHGHDHPEHEHGAGHDLAEGHEHADGHEHGHAEGHEHGHADEHPHEHPDSGAAAHGHPHPHEHGDGHEHPHDDDHAHEHGHGHEHPHGDETHDHEHAPETDDDEAGGFHSHGLFRHTHLPEQLPDGGLSWRALFALGLSGGLVPSASAVIVLLVSISLGRPAYGVVLTIAFGLGMAVVLIGIGVALVYARGFIERMPRRTRLAGLMRYVPMATAVFVLAVGILVTIQALSQAG